MSLQLSVVVPCYNHAAFLERCVNSVLSQVDDTVEVIIVDDGSTDGTANVAGQLPDGIRFCRQRNAGPSSARNNGLRQARGRYVAFLDADDIWLPGFASTMLGELEAHPSEVAVVACGWQWIDLHDKSLSSPCRPEEGALDWPGLILKCPFPIHAAVARRDVIAEVGGFDCNVAGAEDWDLWLRVRCAGYRLSTVNGTLVGYRVVPASISSNHAANLSAGLAVIGRISALPCAPTSARELGARSRAYRYLDAAAGTYQQHRDEEAEGYVRQAVAAWPGALVDRHSLYALACARIERPYTNLSLLDLDEAESRCLHLLGILSDEHESQTRASIARLYEVLGSLARATNRPDTARRYARQAVRTSSPEVARGAIQTWAMSWFDPWRAR